MGSCVSLHKNSDSVIERSKNESLIISSPLKHNPVAVNGQDHSVAGLAVKSHRSLPCSRDYGSKDDAFFDSQPWLESDCEDDFLSVNGDFTPSRGSTPVHHKFSSKPQPHTIGSVVEPSPKKRLSELFQDSLRHKQDADEDVESSDASVVVENQTSEHQEEDKSIECCRLPRLRSSRSSSLRKKKTSLPNGT